MYTLSAAKVSFLTSIASLTSYHNFKGKISFSHRLPPPFDIDFVKCEWESDDLDKDWLPNVKDIMSSNYSVLVNLTGDLDSEVCHYTRHKTRMITGSDMGGHIG